MTSEEALERIYDLIKTHGKEFGFHSNSLEHDSLTFDVKDEDGESSEFTINYCCVQPKES